MIHYSCDMCGKPMPTGDDSRYVVKMEVFAAYDPMEITQNDLDDDSMEELDGLLHQMDDMDVNEIEDDVYKSFRFDVCPTCRRKLVRNPLGNRPTRELGFSEN